MNTALETVAHRRQHIQTLTQEDNFLFFLVLAFFYFWMFGGDFVKDNTVKSDIGIEVYQNDICRLVDEYIDTELDGAVESVTDNKNTKKRRLKSRPFYFWNQIINNTQ